MRGGLAVGDHEDHRLGGAVLVEEAAREHQPVLQVGALHAVPVVLDERVGRHDPRVVAETDDLDGVLRVLGGDQRVQRERGRLGLAPRAPQLHRVGHVDEQGDGRGRAALGLDHLEVLGRQL